MVNASNGCFDINVELEVHNQSLYKVTLSTACQMQLQKIGFSRIIFDRTQMQNNGYFFIEYGLNEVANNQNPSLQFDVSNYLTSDLIMGIHSFTLQSEQNLLFQSQMANITTINYSLHTASNAMNFSYLYVRYRSCPENYSYFQLSNFSCSDFCPNELKGCTNCA